MLGINPPTSCLINCLFSYPIALNIPSSCFLFVIIDEINIYKIKYISNRVITMITIQITLLKDILNY